MAPKKKSQGQTATPEGAGEVLIPAPLVLEMARSLARAGPILLALAVFGLSLAQGASVLAAGLRAGAALFVTGLFGWFATFLLARETMNALVSHRANSQRQTPTAGTQEWEA